MGNFRPATVDFSLAGKPAVLYCLENVTAKLTTTRQTATKFMLVYGTQIVFFYTVQGTYPWLFVRSRSEDSRICVYIENSTKYIAQLTEHNYEQLKKSNSDRLSFMARHYMEICAVLEQLSRYFCEDSNSLHRLVGSPLELRQETNYPVTHKSPTEHIRKAHMRTCKSGKQTLVHETLVCAGR